MLYLPVPLPRVGHRLLVFPMAAQPVVCAGITVGTGRYVMLAPANVPRLIAPLTARGVKAPVLLLLLSPGFIDEMADFLGIDGALEPLLDGVPLLQGDFITPVLRQLADTLSVPGSGNHELVTDLFLEVVGEVLRLRRLRQEALRRLQGRRAATVADQLPRLLQARQLVESRYLTPLKAREVAAHVALSEYHFARLFRTAFDVTLHQYVMQLRLDQARRLLAAPGASVTETALTVGYESLSSFTHAFRRRFGVPPSHCLAP